MQTQLICTFVKYGEEASVVKKISTSFDIISGRIFLLKMPSNKYEILLSYNVVLDCKRTFLKNSILVHRKTETNTIYTINALNSLIVELNNGVLDRKFLLDWSLYANTLLLKKQDAVQRIRIENVGVYDV